jgi:hypothetical protein
MASSAGALAVVGAEEKKEADEGGGGGGEGEKAKNSHDHLLAGKKGVADELARAQSNLSVGHFCRY